MKNAFYYTLKALLVPKIFKFLCSLFGNVEERLGQKDQINFRIYEVKAWLTIAIHILINISRSKTDQAMKFGQLIEYYSKNIFREKSYAKCSGDSFLKNQNCAYLWISSLINFYTISFCIYVKLRIILKLNCRPINFKAFLENKSRSGTSLSASFSA